MLLILISKAFKENLAYVHLCLGMGHPPTWMKAEV